MAKFTQFRYAKLNLKKNGKAPGAIIPYKVPKPHMVPTEITEDELPAYKHHYESQSKINARIIEPVVGLLMSCPGFQEQALKTLTEMTHRLEAEIDIISTCKIIPIKFLTFQQEQNWGRHLLTY